MAGSKSGAQVEGGYVEFQRERGTGIKKERGFVKKSYRGCSGRQKLRTKGWGIYCNY